MTTTPQTQQRKALAEENRARAEEHQQNRRVAQLADKLRNVWGAK